MKIPTILFSFVVLSLATYLAYGYSESFELPVSTILNPAPITRSVELTKGQRVVGDYQFGGLLGVDYWTLFVIKDPNDNLILEHLNKLTDSFNFSAGFSGVYTFAFAFGSSTLNVSPEAMLNYEIQSSGSTFNPFNVDVPPTVWYLIIGLVIVPIASYLIFKRVRKR